MRLRSRPSKSKRTRSSVDQFCWRPNCISLLYTVCGFCIQSGANAAKAEIKKVLCSQAKARGSKPKQFSILNYETVALPLSYIGLPVGTRRFGPAKGFKENSRSEPHSSHFQRSHFEKIQIGSKSIRSLDPVAAVVPGVRANRRTSASPPPASRCFPPGETACGSGRGCAAAGARGSKCRH